MGLDKIHAESSYKPTQCKRHKDKMERVQQGKGHWCGQELEHMAFGGEAEVGGLVWSGEEKAQAWGNLTSDFHNLGSD